jgi:hypothetical protein
MTHTHGVERGYACYEEMKRELNRTRIYECDEMLKD